MFSYAFFRLGDYPVELSGNASPIPTCLQYIDSRIDAELKATLIQMRRQHDSRKLLLYPQTIIDVDTGVRCEEWHFKGPGLTPEEFAAEKAMAASSNRPYAIYHIAYDPRIGPLIVVRPYTVDD